MAISEEDAENSLIVGFQTVSIGKPSEKRCWRQLVGKAEFGLYVAIIISKNSLDTIRVLCDWDASQLAYWTFNYQI
jgi:hypothetical protein